MSAPQPATAWQQAELVEEFLQLRKTVLPLLDVQEDLVRTIFERHGHAIERFLDVGAGAGAMTELILSIAPKAEAVLVDNSEPMLAAAERRLQGGGGRWRIARADLREPSWAAPLERSGYDAAVSGYAIHHLTAQRKRELFAEIFELLAPGAMFVNMDVVLVAGPLHGLHDEQMVRNAIAAEHAHGGQRSDGEIAQDTLADDNEDRPDPLERQLEWLGEAGFVDAEVHFKWAEAAVFGAVKPQGASS